MRKRRSGSGHRDPDAQPGALRSVRRRTAKPSASPARSPATTPSTRRPTRAEAGQFQEAGFSTVICGPGSIDQAHQPNEFIELDQVDQCERFLRRLMDDLSR